LFDGCFLNSGVQFIDYMHTDDERGRGAEHGVCGSKPDGQAIFFFRRHQPRRPPLVKIRPGLLCLKQSVLTREGQHAYISSVIGWSLAIQPFRRQAYDGDAPKRQDHRKRQSDRGVQHRRWGRGPGLGGWGAPEPR
jgi:hypothetical protein